jgi:hypothetical protein
MENDKPGSEIQQQFRQNTPNSESPEPQSLSNYPHSRDAQSITEQRVRDDTRGFDGRVKRAEWYMIGLTAAIALFALCAVGVGVVQWHAMEGQLGEMRNSGIDARNAMRLDQRAWVGVVKVNSFDLRIGPNFSVPFDMTNSGKTPALNVMTKTSLKTIEKRESFIPTYSDPTPTKPSRGVIQPQMHMELSSLPANISPTQYEDIENGRGILYAYGDITYDDIFGLTHETTFCVMYWTGLAGPILCDTYNNAT